MSKPRVTKIYPRAPVSPDEFDGDWIKSAGRGDTHLSPMTDEQAAQVAGVTVEHLRSWPSYVPEAERLALYRQDNPEEDHDAPGT